MNYNDLIQMMVYVGKSPQPPYFRLVNYYCNSPRASQFSGSSVDVRHVLPHPPPFPAARAGARASGQVPLRSGRRAGLPSGRRCAAKLAGAQLGPPVVPFLTPFLVATKIDYRKKGTLILTSLLEDLVRE